MKYLKLFCSSLLFSLVLISYSFAYIFIDVDEHDLYSGKKGLRIVTFDTEKQKFLSVDYCHSPHPQREQIIFSDKWEIDYDTFSGDVTLPQGFDLTNFIIRTHGSFINFEEFNDSENNKKILRKSSVGPENQEDIYAKLQQFSKSPKGKLSLTLSIKNSDKFKEYGILGELATEMTFLSYGYSKLPSQNGSNQGLDGVYVDSILRPTSLFLTESKYRSESKSAENYMSTELTETHICKKMQKAPKKTRDIIRKFIEHKPLAIYKLVHRIKNGGTEISIRPFSQKGYSAYLLGEQKLTAEETRVLIQTVISKIETKKGGASLELNGLFSTMHINEKAHIGKETQERYDSEITFLSPQEIKKIKVALNTLEVEKREEVLEIALFGIPVNEFDVLLSDTIEPLVRAVTDLPLDQMKYLPKVEDVIFSSNYYDVNLDHFAFEDRLSLFHSFLNSKYNHLSDEENRQDLLYQYHIIYNSLREMDIESEEIFDGDYLARYVEDFKELTDEDLKDLCHTINDLYDSKTFSELKGIHDCTNWEDLATQLRDLNEEQHKYLPYFLKCLPSTFNFAPSEAIKTFKDESWFEMITDLEDFETVSKLADYAFDLYEEPADQLKALKIILRNLTKNHPHEKIKKKIKNLKKNPY